MAKWTGFKGGQFHAVASPFDLLREARSGQLLCPFRALLPSGSRRRGFNPFLASGVLVGGKEQALSIGFNEIREKVCVALSYARRHERWAKFIRESRLKRPS